MTFDMKDQVVFKPIEQPDKQDDIIRLLKNINKNILKVLEEVKKI